MTYSEDNESQQTLLADESEDFLDEKSRSRSSLSQLTSRNDHYHHLTLLVQVIFLVCNVVLLLFNSGVISVPRRSSDPPSVQAPFSPARSGIEYRIENINTREMDDPYTGTPRPEIDEAWSKLLRATTIRLTEDELREMNQPSMSFKDGSGYVGYIEAFHMLHCVKRLYQFQYPEYYQDLKNDDKLGLKHWNHCLQVLRKGIMCNIDVTMNTFVHDDLAPGNVSGITTGPRKCANWDHFEQWAYERSVHSDVHTLLVQGHFGENGPADVVDGYTWEHWSRV